MVEKFEVGKWYYFMPRNREECATSATAKVCPFEETNLAEYSDTCKGHMIKHRIVECIKINNDDYVTPALVKFKHIDDNIITAWNWCSEDFEEINEDGTPINLGIFPWKIGMLVKLKIDCSGCEKNEMCKIQYNSDDDSYFAKSFKDKGNWCDCNNNWRLQKEGYVEDNILTYGDIAKACAALSSTDTVKFECRSRDLYPEEIRIREYQQNEVNKMELKDMNKVNLREAKKQFEKEKANEEVEFAKHKLRETTDMINELEREIKNKQNIIASLKKEYLSFFK